MRQAARTWHATVLAAVGVAEHALGAAAGRKRAIARAVAEVAGYLGNTPAGSATSLAANGTLRAAGM